MRLMLLFSILSTFLITKPVAAKELVDRIIAIVNSEIVLQSDLRKLQSRLGKPGAIDDTLLLGENVSSLKNNEKAQLEFLIREKLVESEIKRQGLSVGNDRIETELSELARKNQMSRAEFNKIIIKQGFSLDEFKSMQKNRIERQSFFESEIVSKLRITDEDAYGEYQNKNPDARPNINEFSIAQIFFSPKNGGAGAALVRAQSVLARIREGESFADLANKFNETPGAAKDGYLGSFRAGEFLPDMERAVSALEVGAVSEVVRGPAGYHIVKVLSKKTILDPSFVRVKEMIKASLVEKNFQRQLKNWFESKKQDAYIKIQTTNS